MSEFQHQNYVEVINFLRSVDDLILTHVKVLSGKIKTDMILESEETGEQWRVISIAHIHWLEIPKDDIRGIALEALEKNSELRSGMRLFVRN